MKLFTDADVAQHGAIAGAGRLPVNHGDCALLPLPWQKLGLSQTATGYGAKLTSFYKINFNGKLYRIYHTCYGNAASGWFTVKGRRIYVS